MSGERWDGVRKWPALGWGQPAGELMSADKQPPRPRVQIVPDAQRVGVNWSRRDLNYRLQHSARQAEKEARYAKVRADIQRSTPLGRVVYALTRLWNRLRGRVQS